MIRTLSHPAAALIAAAALLPAAAPAQVPDANGARNLAATCASCHGTHGQARGEMPPLAGRSAASIVALFAAFKSGALPATVMHQIAKGYTDEQVQLIATYLAAQPARAAP